MISSARLPCCFLVTLASFSQADWPQWRGADRTGVCPDPTPLLSSVGEEGFKQVWASGEIPSDHYGGHSSPVVADGKVILSVVWHKRVPSETRVLDAETMQTFNHRGVPKELAAKMEEARMNLSPRLRGEKLEQFITDWNKANLNPEQQIALGSWVASRFKAGKTAIGLEWLDKIASRQEKPFASAAAMVAWLDEEKFPPDIRQKVIDTVPNTVKVADDTILAFDLKTGKELWKCELPGEPTGRRSSATPAVVNGRVYTLGSTHVYAVNAADGKVVWKSPLIGKGPGSSPLVADGKVFVTSSRVAAYNAETGEKIWETKEVRAGDGSPTWWAPTGGKPHVVVNTPNNLVGLDPATGVTLWEAEGGSQSTPVASGDYLVVYSSKEGVGLRAYQYQAGVAPKALWSNYWLTRRYSGTPIIHNGLVYAMCGEKHLCFDLVSGKKHWDEVVNSTISSPLMADGKIFIQENNGTHIRVVKADAASYQMLARSKAGAMGCASPAIAGGHLIVRQKDKLVAYDIKAPVP
jgi:outer membrane protein assembly factor BamB